MEQLYHAVAEKFCILTEFAEQQTGSGGDELISLSALMRTFKERESKTTILDPNSQHQREKIKTKVVELRKAAEANPELLASLTSPRPNKIARRTSLKKGATAAAADGPLCIYISVSPDPHPMSVSVFISLSLSLSIVCVCVCVCAARARVCVDIL